MDLSKLKEPLSIKDIDFRIQSINKGGYATILAYKDARVDMNRLDDVVGAENWQRNHKEVKGVVYCGIGINIQQRRKVNSVITEVDDMGWVWKWDAGSESFTDKEKGEASDSFKRAGFNWGIGRELYDYPIIQIKLNADEFEIYKDKNGYEKVRATWNLKLRDWKWGSEFKDGVLTKLAAMDEKGNLRYNYKLNK